MSHTNDPEDALVAAHDRFLALEPPHRKRRGITDMEIDLSEEGAYLTGLTQRVRNGSPLPVASIRLKPSIDEALRTMRGKTEDEHGWIRDLVAYRAAMLELAEALSAASGLPIVRLEATE